MFNMRLDIRNEFKLSATWRDNSTEDSVIIQNNSSKTNETNYELDNPDYIFDRTEVRAIFITMYTLVFCCCFFGRHFCKNFVVPKKGRKAAAAAAAAAAKATPGAGGDADTEKKSKKHLLAECFYNRNVTPGPS